MRQKNFLVIRLFLLSLIIFSAPLRCFGQLVIYPSPGDESLRSTYYRIWLKAPSGDYIEPFVYVTHAQLPKFNRSKSTSYCIFSHSGPVEVRVIPQTQSAKTCNILPSSYGIETKILGDTIIFRLDQPRKVAVELNKDISHPLLIFADDPETTVPDHDDPDVIWFGQGVHDLNEPIEPKSGQTIYLAGGAFVKGLIRGENVKNVTVRGRGILSGRKYGHTGGRHILFEGEQSIGITIKGITIVDAPGFYVTTRGPGTHVKNIKGIGWWFNTDGIVTGPDGLIEDCFLKCNDDAIKLYYSGMEVYRTTIWQMENGAPFQISWNMTGEQSGFVVKDCDVIHCDHAWDNTNTAVFDAIHGGSGHMSDYLFEDIRIENCDWRLVSIQVRPNKFSRSDTLGTISNVHFKNVSINTSGGKALKRLNIIQGHDENSMVQDFLFEDLKINGRYISNAREGRFEISQRTTKNIEFQVTGDDKNGISREKKHEGPEVMRWTNPITDGLNSYGQMHFYIFRDNGFYYLVATEHPNLEWGKRGVILYRSPDLLHWREEAFLINRNNLSEKVWYRDEWMAPKVHKIGDQYYLTFNCRNNITDPYGQLGIGMAVSEHLTGPYEVLNNEKPLALGNNTTLFEDDDGTIYALWDHDGRFYGCEMNLEQGEFAGEPREILGPYSLKEHFRYLDSPFIMKKNDRYYLLFSSFYGGYIVRIRYVIADHPLGPWKLATTEPLMEFYEAEADQELKMPWSSSHPFAPPTQVIFQTHIFKGPGGQYYVAYHSSEKYSEPYLILEPVQFNNKGDILLPAYKEKCQEVKLK